MKATQIATVIVDDEAPARRLLRRLLETERDVRIVGECSSGPEAVQMIRQSKPDLVLLDIQMPGMDGFGVLTELSRETLPAIIFVTAFDRYAVRAFEAHALDYLLKPVDRKRFADAMERARKATTSRRPPQQQRLRSLLRDWQKHVIPASPASERKEYLQRIVTSSHGKIHSLGLQDVVWLEAADHFVIAHSGRGKFLLSESLSALERSLPPDMFVRIHRGLIANCRHVEAISTGRFGSCTVTMTNGARLRVSRSRRESVLRLLPR